MDKTKRDKTRLEKATSKIKKTENQFANSSNSNVATHKSNSVLYRDINRQDQSSVPNHKEITAKPLKKEASKKGKENQGNKKGSKEKIKESFHLDKGEDNVQGTNETIKLGEKEVSSKSEKKKVPQFLIYLLLVIGMSIIIRFVMIK